MFRRRTTLVLCAGLAAAAAPIAGCGGDGKDRTVDAQQVEQGIEQDLSSSTIQISSVSCPGDVKSETGAKFTCHAKLKDGGSADVVVTETQAPNQFAYSLKPGTLELAGSTVDKAVEDSLAKKGVAGATVNCPDPVKVKAGTTVTCPVSGAGGGVGTVSFQLTSSGSVDSSSVETGS